jgi:hypothetical protein
MAHAVHEMTFPAVRLYLRRNASQRHPVERLAGRNQSMDRTTGCPAPNRGGALVARGVPRGGRSAALSSQGLFGLQLASAFQAFVSAVSYGRSALVLLAMMVPFAPAFAGVPFVTDDADTPDAGHFEINIAAQYTRFQGGSVGAVPSVEVDYGLTSKLELSVLAPLAMSHVDGVGTNVGVGDLELGFKYRFIESDDWGWRPGVAFAPTISMTSGSEVRGLGEGRMLGFLPIWLSKDFNQWTVFGGGGYNINPGTDRLNWWFAGLGVTRELNPEWTIGVEIYYATPTGQGLKNSTGFNVGAIYNINDVHHLMVSVGRNLINARENNEFSTFIGYQITF